MGEMSLYSSRKESEDVVALLTAGLDHRLLTYSIVKSKSC